MRKPSTGFPNRFDINRPVQQQKQARSLKFPIQEDEGLYYPCSKIKALISFAISHRQNSGFLMARLITYLW